MWLCVWEGCLETQGLPDWHKHTTSFQVPQINQGESLLATSPKACRKLDIVLIIFYLFIFKLTIFRPKSSNSAFPRRILLPENALKLQLDHKKARSYSWNTSLSQTALQFSRFFCFPSQLSSRLIKLIFIHETAPASPPQQVYEGQTSSLSLYPTI